jgi:hypothetical protein
MTFWATAQTWAKHERKAAEFLKLFGFECLPADAPAISDPVSPPGRIQVSFVSGILLRQD